MDGNVLTLPPVKMTEPPSTEAGRAATRRPARYPRGGRIPRPAAAPPRPPACVLTQRVVFGQTTAGSRPTTTTAANHWHHILPV